MSKTFKYIIIATLLLLAAASLKWLFGGAEVAEPEPAPGATADGGSRDYVECDDFFSGHYEPLRDRQTFVDGDYTEVTAVSRDEWDAERLPPQVAEFEGQGYFCNPYPLELDPQGGPMETMVLSVEWECELPFDEWEYVPNHPQILDDYRMDGFECEQDVCGENDDPIWLCTK